MGKNFSHCMLHGKSFDFHLTISTPTCYKMHKRGARLAKTGTSFIKNAVFLILLAKHGRRVRFQTHPNGRIP